MSLEPSSTPARPRGRPRNTEINFDELWWCMRRVAVWKTMFGWWTPWMKPGCAWLFLSKNWKHLEYKAHCAFAEGVHRRWLK